MKFLTARWVLHTQNYVPTTISVHCITSLDIAVITKQRMHTLFGIKRDYRVDNIRKASHMIAHML